MEDPAEREREVEAAGCWLLAVAPVPVRCDSRECPAAAPEPVRRHRTDSAAAVAKAAFPGDDGSGGGDGTPAAPSNLPGWLFCCLYEILKWRGRTAGAAAGRGKQK